MTGDKGNVGPALEKLEVAVKGGGSIVSHPPTFSKDCKTLIIVQNNTLLLHDVTSGRVVGRFCTPSASPIANVAITPDDDRLLVFTSSGKLLEVEVPSLSVIRTTEVIWRNKNWPPAISFSNFIWPSTVSPAFPSSASYFFMVGFSQDSSILPSLYSAQLIPPDKGRDDTHSQLLYRHECAGIVGSHHSVSCGKNGRFIVSIQPDHLFVKDMVTNAVRWHKGGSRRFTALAAHPTEWSCATGDDSGRILLWSNLLNEGGSVSKSVYHWHTLPVADLCFSTSGSQIYSGGAECTLVKWDLNNTGNKRTLPRLGLPIRHVRASGSDEMIAISQADNSIKLVNAYNEVVTQIQNLTQCYIPEGLDDINISRHSLGGCAVFQAGLHLDPNNSSLITNGKPGQLQCYSFKEDRHLYNLDITQQNFITAERNNTIPNSDVSHISYSKNGSWLTTVESRRDSDSRQCTELRLKFWKFERERQIFLLNTSVDWAHEKGIVSLKFQPIQDSNPTLVAATTGLDQKFKTWAINHDSSLHGKSEWWNCEFIGSYRNLNAGPCSYSEDGSILAIAFERSLTIWSTDSNELKLSLSHSKLGENISLLEFGSHQSSHLVIAASGGNLSVWDIITSSLLWVAPFHAETLAVDPYSNLAAAFSSKHHLILFSPDESTPLAIHKNVSSSKIVSALFVPHGKSFENIKLKSTLFFINTSQELCALLPPVEQEEKRLRISAAAGTSVLTPFAQLLAEKTVYERQPSTPTSSVNQVGLEGYKVLRDIMDQSPHTMPSLTYFCSKLLQALSVRRTPGDRLKEVENVASASSKKIKYIKHGHPSTDDEEEVEDQGHHFSFGGKKSGLKFKMDSNSSQVVQPFNVELDQVVSDDKAWIDAVFDTS